MRRDGGVRILVLAMLLAATTAGAAEAASSSGSTRTPRSGYRPSWADSTHPVALNHLYIMVRPGAPERAALESLGFRIAPDVNRHVGQGTASCTIEFVNGFLGFVWPDSSVPVAPGKEFLRERFRQRMDWRTTGKSPFGIGLRRTSSVIDSLPFRTWPLTAEWMPPGSAIERLTPLSDSLGAMIFVGPRALAIPPDSNIAALIANNAQSWQLRHPNGCRQISSLRVVAPARGLNEATARLDEWNVVRFERGADWLAEVTLDRGRKGKIADLRPGLPLIVRY